jgi:hypothetical protein
MGKLSGTILSAVLLVGTVAMMPPPPTGGMPAPAPPPPGPPAPVNAAPMNGPAAPSVNPQMLALAERWLTALQDGTVDRSQLAGGAYAKTTNATIAKAPAMIGNLGTPVGFVQQQTMQQGDVSAAIYVVTFKNGEKFDFFIAVDNEGKVQSLTLDTSP